MELSTETIMGIAGIAVVLSGIIIWCLYQSQIKTLDTSTRPGEEGRLFPTVNRSIQDWIDTVGETYPLWSEELKAALELVLKDQWITLHDSKDIMQQDLTFDRTVIQTLPSDIQIQIWLFIWWLKLDGSTASYHLESGSYLDFITLREQLVAVAPDTVFVSEPPICVDNGSKVVSFLHAPFIHHPLHVLQPLDENGGHSHNGYVHNLEMFDLENVRYLADFGDHYKIDKKKYSVIEVPFNLFSECEIKDEPITDTFLDGDHLQYVMNIGGQNRRLSRKPGYVELTSCVDFREYMYMTAEDKEKAIKAITANKVDFARWCLHCNYSLAVYVEGPTIDPGFITDVGVEFVVDELTGKHCLIPVFRFKDNKWQPVIETTFMIDWSMIDVLDDATMYPIIGHDLSFETAWDGFLETTNSHPEQEA